MSEDSLNLNIWTPEDANNAPVLLWIHGGSLIWGANSEPLYDGNKLARRGLVVVSINYRLGIFGYLAHPDLSAEAADGVSGNYGLMDQVAALEWVRKNISAFGGNPDNITIAGESAGALSVLYLMSSPKARGLFAKAIAQSAYAISTPSLSETRFGLRSAEECGSCLASDLGATTIAQLRSLDAASLAEMAIETGFAPSGTVDGLWLPDQIIDIFERGEQAKVPLLIGFNDGEIRSLPFLAPQPPACKEDYEVAIRESYGHLADRFLALYPSSDMPESIVAAVRDAIYGWTAERIAQTQANAGISSYLYAFDHGYPAADQVGLHAFHGAEIPYVFGNLTATPPLWPAIPINESELNLSDAMADYWASFAFNGEPNAADRAVWQPYINNASYMRFAGMPQPSEEPYPGTAALHDEVIRLRRASADTPWNWNVGIAAPSPHQPT